MTEIFANPNRMPRGRAPRSEHGAEARAFHRRLPGYAATPLVSAPALAAGSDVANLWVKDESTRLGLPAFKILGASWAVYRLLVDRLGHEPEWRALDDLRDAFSPLGRLQLVAATDGNHGRAVARMAALLGYESTILVPSGTARGRITSIEGEGASVTIVDGTYDDAVAAAAALAGTTTLVVSDTSWPGYTAVPNWVIEGYATIFAEVDEQLGSAVPDVVVVQMGVGALAAAVADHFADTSAVVAVEPDSAACGMAAARAGHPVDVPGPHDSIMAGLNCGRVSIVAWPRIAAGVDVFVTVDDPAAERAMRALAGVGIVAGETGAAGLAGFDALRGSDPVASGIDLREANVLLLCTEGATDPIAYERIVGTPPR